ncbi:hypothetical protein LS71_003730 [Helicobacter jaachi]|uniref:O-antigen ligase-related domain-containing protein n=1 Tax=Helicobacter jaachi TaxID=1677920 RepID=A0A4U8TA37_9HELI|nr:O-antigen ligase family protein [Helicobacter jaachi]TLD96730.1 hypothetical protein LS71_003730 [Helicobacter jaachi]
MGVLKKYNEEITLILFCLGLLFYSIGLSQFTRSIRTQSLFHIGGLIFIIFHYKAFNKYTLRVLLVPIICFGVVLVCALLTAFDDVWEHKFSIILKSINQNIIGHFVLFSMLFLYALHAKARNVKILLIFFVLVCIVQVLAMDYLGLKKGLLKGGYVPFFHRGIIMYNIWLLAPMAMSLAGIFAFKNRIYKLLSVLGVLLTLCAMLTNSERSFLVAFVVMIFVPFFAWHYRHKFAIICSALVVGAVFLSSFYHISKSLPERYNFAHMVDNFLIVWNTPPAEMGQYDANCFAKQKWLICANQSLERGKSDISWEHSSLSRIAMAKSTWLAWLDNPLKPHVVGVFLVGEYLARYHAQNDTLNRSYIAGFRFKKTTDNNDFGYVHIHNFPLSLLFCYGLVGFMAIIAFQIFLLISAQRRIRVANDNQSGAMGFWALSLCIFVCGLCVQCLFDGIYSGIMQSIFIYYGFMCGVMWREDCLNYR